MSWMACTGRVLFSCIRDTSILALLTARMFASAIGVQKNTFTVNASKMVATIAAIWCLRIGISQSVACTMQATRSNLKFEKSQIGRQVRLLVFYEYAFLVLAPRALEGAPIVIR